MTRRKFDELIQDLDMRPEKEEINQQIKALEEKKRLVGKVRVLAASELRDERVSGIPSGIAISVMTLIGRPGELLQEIDEVVTRLLAIKDRLQQSLEEDK